MPLTLPKRHKWFSNWDRDSEDGWWGPHDTIEAAARECVVMDEGPDRRIFIVHGYKLKESERYDEFAWEVDARNAFEIILPKQCRP